MNQTDQLPPHDLTSERAVIGAAIERDTLAADLRVDWFYDLRYRQAAETLIGMAAARQPIDAGTAAQAMTAAGIANAAALVSECANECYSSANFPHWREILTEKLTLRRMIRIGQDAITTAYEAGRDSTRKPADCLNDFERDVLSIRRQVSGGADGETDNKTALLELAAEYEQAQKDGRPRGLATGFYDLDALLGGLKPCQLVIIAARPAVGKTSLALGMAERIALTDGLPVGFVSLEMSAKELLHRLVCSRAHVDGGVLNRGGASDADIRNVTVASARIAKAPLHICDAGGLTIAQLTARARRMVQQYDIKVLFVDYLGLLRSGEKGRGRYEETTLVSNALKGLAKELSLPVVVLAQLNRDTEREGRMPRLSDLRDSGAIEQDADVVALLHAKEGQPGDTQIVSLIVAKQRAGRTGMIDLIFNRSYTRFENKSNE